MQEQPPPLEGETEHGMDGWHVWGPEENLLFYSKHPIVRVPLAAGHQPPASGLQSQDREVNVETASHRYWTPLMISAHDQVRTLLLSRRCPSLTLSSLNFAAVEVWH